MKKKDRELTEKALPYMSAEMKTKIFKLGTVKEGALMMLGGRAHDVATCMSSFGVG